MEVHIFWSSSGTVMVSKLSVKGPADIYDQQGLDKDQCGPPLVAPYKYWNCWEFHGSCPPCNMISSMTIYRTAHEQNAYNFITITVSGHALAPLGVRIWAGTVMTKSGTVMTISAVANVNPCLVLEQNVYNFIIITVSTHALTPLGVRIWAGTVMTKSDTVMTKSYMQ